MTIDSDDYYYNQSAKLPSFTSYLGRLKSINRLANIVAATTTTTTTTTTKQKEIKHQETEISSIQTESTISTASEISKSAISLLLRLVNDTFISLPIIDCRTITSQQYHEVSNELNQQQQAQLEQQVKINVNRNEQQIVYDACFINWSEAKLVQNSNHMRKIHQFNANYDNQEKNEFSLSNLLVKANNVNSSILSSIDALPSSSSSSTIAAATTTNLESSTLMRNSMNENNKFNNSSLIVDYNLAKLTYLSISSLLSACGIFINFFIILVIIFNTKQKRRSVTRSSNTGQNNLLLFQLSITGFLLASYVLIENINIQQKRTVFLRPNSPQTEPQDPGIDIHVSSLTSSSLNIRNPSPLSTFLPSTPFESQRTSITCSDNFEKINCEPVSLYEDIVHDENVLRNDNFESLDEQEQSQKDLVLIFKLNTTGIGKIPSNNRLERESFWYLRDGGKIGDGGKDQGSYLIDLNDVIKSIFIAYSECRSSSNQPYDDDGDDINETAQKDTKSKFDSPIRDRNSKRTPSIPDDFNRYNGGISNGSGGDRKDGPPLNQSSYVESSIVLDSVPLLVNFIASIHIWTVAALAYDRYCAIANPLQYLRSIHASRTKGFLIITWTVSLMLGLLMPLLLNLISADYRNVNNLDSMYSNIKPIEREQVNSEVFNHWHSWNMQDNSDFNSSDKPIESKFNTRFKRNETDTSGFKLCNFSQKRSNLHQQLLKDENGDFLIEAKKLIQHLKNNWSKTNQQGNNVTGNSFGKQKEGRANQLILSKLASLFVESSLKSMNSQTIYNNNTNFLKSESVHINLYIVILLIFSLFSFVVFILVPLLIITVCNISIYRIVKVHERRVSVGSGNNITASSGNLSNQTTRLPNNRRDNVHTSGLDDRSDINSITSLFMSKLMKVGLMRTFSRQDDLSSSCLEQEACRSCLSYNNYSNNKQFDFDKFTSETKIDRHSKSIENNSTIVNRSKRLVARQDSYQILSKSNADENRSLDNEKINQVKKDDHIINQKAGGSDSVLFNSTDNNQKQRGKLKRKVSDHTLCSSYVSRRHSNGSNFDYYCDQNRDIEYDPSSCLESPNSTNHSNHQQNTKQNQGIINQLKMAGLSFAGIAIQEPLNNMGHINNNNGPNNSYNRTLNKSSSYSLGNLNSSHYWNQQLSHNNNQSGGSSLSRCSVGSSSTITNPRKSYTSLSKQAMDNVNHNNNHNHHHNQTNNKYTTKLLPDGYGGDIEGNHHNHPNRLPFTIGTKSAAFNVVIWLILTMLIFTLPHYLLVTVDQIIRFNSSSAPLYNLKNGAISGEQIESNFESNKIDRNLKSLIEYIFPSRNTTEKFLPHSSDNSHFGIYDQDKKFNADQSILREISIWLSCLCRILFLTMVPLNGWLYGIKSRSLRAKIRMVLKRYISRRQASIEINSRQRSTNSGRSRDSSFMNLPPLYYQHNVEACANCNYQAPLERPERVFRRCSSFGGRRNQLANYRLATQCFNNNISLDHSNEKNLSRENSASNLTLTPSSTTVIAKQKSLVPNNNSTIRFVIGDYITDCESDNSSTLNPQSPNNIRYMSPNTSLDSSLTSSDRSLISHSIHSSLSVAFSILDQPKSPNHQATSEPIEQNNCQVSSAEKAIRNSKSQTIDSELPKSCCQSTLNSKQKEHNCNLENKRFSNYLIDQSNHQERTHKNHDFQTNDLSSSLESTNLFFGCDHRLSQPSKKQSRLNSQTRRNSNLETTESMSSNRQKNLEHQQQQQHNKCQVRKSFSEFKFFVTSTDQADGDHGTELSNVQLNRECESKELIAKYDGIDYESLICSKVQPTLKQHNPSDKQMITPYITRWKQFKQNLTRLLLNSAAKVLSEKYIHDDIVKKENIIGRNNSNVKDYCLVFNPSCCNDQVLSKESLVESSSVASASINNIIQDPCRTSLLRRNSVDSSNTTTWRENYSRLHNKHIQTPIHKKEMRNSLTLNNFDTIDCTKRHCSKHRPHQTVKHCSDKAYCDQKNNSINQNLSIDQQSPTHLKPPNFLKLIFDPTNNHSTGYLGASALSPIKECSSNHSYASSQSSLIMTNQQNENPSGKHPNEICSEIQIETIKLVKNSN